MSYSISTQRSWAKKSNLNLSIRTCLASRWLQRSVYLVFLACHIVSCFGSTYVYLFETLIWKLGKPNVGDDESSCTAEARHIETSQQCGGGWGLVCVTPATIWPGSYFIYVSLDLVSVLNGTNCLFRQIQPRNVFQQSWIQDRTDKSFHVWHSVWEASDVGHSAQLLCSHGFRHVTTYNILWYYG